MSNFTDKPNWENRANADKIPCPALLSFYNNHFLNPDADGNITTEELDKVLTHFGVGTTIRKVLLAVADISDNQRDEQFNLFTLRDSKLDHTGSTGVRDPEVNPDKIEEALLQFSEDGLMYSKHFAAAANHALKAEAGLRGTFIQTIEYAALLEVFGHLDASTNQRYLRVEEVKDLWLDGKLPVGWQPRTVDETGLGDLTSGVAHMVLKRMFEVFGFTASSVEAREAD